MSIVSGQLSVVQRKTRGFTLIELLIVISIIALLVAAATASWTNAQQKSRDSKRKSDLKGIQQALELYFQENGHYPPSTGGKILCHADDPPSKAIDWGKDFTCDLTTTYMNPLPKDPVNSGGFIYKYNSCTLGTSGFLKYQIEAQIENTKDPDTQPSNLPTASCGGATTGYNYRVINP